MLYFVFRFFVYFTRKHSKWWFKTYLFLSLSLLWHILVRHHVWTNVRILCQPQIWYTHAFTLPCVRSVKCPLYSPQYYLLDSQYWYLLCLKLINEVSYVEVLGDKSTMYITVTLYWGYLIVLLPFYLVCILYCGCFNLFCNMWACVCVGFVMGGCFGNMCNCIYCAFV